jgi:hypothetical protein
VENLDFQDEENKENRQIVQSRRLSLDGGRFLLLNIDSFNKSILYLLQEFSIFFSKVLLHFFRAFESRIFAASQKYRFHHRY